MIKEVIIDQPRFVNGLYNVVILVLFCLNGCYIGLQVTSVSGYEIDARRTFVPGGVMDPTCPTSQ